MLESSSDSAVHSEQALGDSEEEEFPFVMFTDLCGLFLKESCSNRKRALAEPRVRA